MKQMRFLDNVRTPEDWQRKALKAAEAECMEPKLKKWQSAGIVAVTAAAVIGMALMPMFYGYSNSDVQIKHTSSDSTPAKSRALLPPEEEYDENPEKWAEYIKDAKAKMNDMYGYTETVNVLDCVKSEDDGTIFLACARESYQFGNHVLCTQLMADGDALSGSKELPKFGDKVVLGFDELLGEECLDMNFTMEVNGRKYLGVQPKGTLFCNGYADLGRWTDGFFGDILRTAQAAARVSDYTFDDTVKYLVRGTYKNINQVKPEVECSISYDKRDTEIKGEMMATLFDEAYVRGGATSQLYVMKIEKTDGGYLWAGSYFDRIEKTCSIGIGGRQYTLKTKCDTDIEILNVRAVADSTKANTAYLLINVIDTERTGNIRGKLKIDVVPTNLKGSDINVIENTVIQMTAAENGDYDFTVEPFGDVVVRKFDDNGNKRTLFLYTFELTASKNADFDEIKNIMFKEDSKKHETSSFVINSNDEYVIRCEDDRVKKLYIARDEEYSGGKLLLMYGVEFDETVSEPPDGITFSFGKKNGDEIVWAGKAEFGGAETQKNTGSEVISIERRNVDYNIDPQR